MSIALETRRHFASDNYAGICPEAFAAMAAANQGHVTSYGDDPWTARAAEMIRELFGTQCEVFFVFNGTAANSLALAAIWVTLVVVPAEPASATGERRLERGRQQHAGHQHRHRRSQRGKPPVAQVVRHGREPLVTRRRHGGPRAEA